MQAFKNMGPIRLDPQRTVLLAVAAALALSSVVFMFSWRKRGRASAAQQKKLESQPPPPPPLDTASDVEVDVALPPLVHNLPEVLVEDASDDENDAPARSVVESVVTELADGGEETREQLERGLDRLLKRGKQNYKAGHFDAAAAHYTQALDLVERLPDDPVRKASLYNNRAAMHEKAGRTTLALADCTNALQLQPRHQLARQRRARIYEALNRIDDAILEFCIVTQLEGEDALVNMTSSARGFLSLVGVRADEEAREIMAHKEANPSRAPPSRHSTYDVLPLTIQVLTLFASYTDLEGRFADLTVAAATDAVKHTEEAAAAESGTAPDPLAVQQWVRALFARGMVNMLAQDYGACIVDLDCAAALALAPPASEALDAATAAVREAQEAFAAGDEDAALDLAGAAAAAALEAAEDADGVPAEEVEAAEAAASSVSDVSLLAEVLCWHATFLQLRHCMTAATALYGRAAGLDGAHPDVWIKLAAVLIDSNKPEEAGDHLQRAVEADEDYGTTYLFRGKMHEAKATIALKANDMMLYHDEQEAAADDYLRFIDLCPDLTQGYVQLSRLHQESGETQEARAALDEGLQRFPQSSQLMASKADFSILQVNRAAQEELSPEYAQQLIAVVQEAFELYDQAIAADPSNPMPLIGKGIAMLQAYGEENGKQPCLDLLNQAAEVDPNSYLVHYHMSLVKMRFTFAEWQEAVPLLDRAIEETGIASEVRECCGNRMVVQAKIRAVSMLAEEIAAAEEA